SVIRIAEEKAAAQEDSAKHRTTIGEYQALLEKQREQNERQDVAIRQLQAAVDALRSENADCREDYAEVRTSYQFLYELTRHLHLIVAKTGLPGAGPLPPMPELKDRPRRAGMEFIIHQAQQTASLVQEADKTIKLPDLVQAQPPDKGPLS
ncbi:MAG: hypothetical protein ACRESF_08155, partial [Pseudomonas sp.]